MGSEKKGPRLKTHTSLVAAEMNLSDQETKDLEEIMKSRQEATRKFMRELHATGASRPTGPDPTIEADTMLRLQAVLGDERAKEFYEKYRQKESALRPGGGMAGGAPSAGASLPAPRPQ
jgi:hypothetical protein